MADKKNKADKDDAPDLSDIGGSSFQMGPFLAVLLLVLAIAMMLWNSFKAEQVTQRQATQPAVQEQTAPAPQQGSAQPLRRSSAPQRTR